VTYSDNKSYYFAPPPLTAGSEDDLIVMPNLPLMGALRRLAGSSLATAGLEAMLGSYSFGIDKSPFIRLTVREFLWGYPSLIMSIDQFQVIFFKSKTMFMAFSVRAKLNIILSYMEKA
jgi:hypothetical protein